ncbi:transcription termination factor MTEF18, mitochondrial-like [Impatiens glandulifera]|uniref:transcription termination factor MTEF18, mitochondrial-like n=1 Tax=Impatiens glandulifera TaxID=253017 RepID=UPI001FB07744|nr:transcription termination factor MTEF18, mitochondrial-like [Impatiens glandulifera]
MIHSQKLRFHSFLKRNHLPLQESFLRPTVSHHITETIRFYGSRKLVPSDNNPIQDDTSASNTSSSAVYEAQTALLEYLHSTRGFLFTDAEYISHHSPLYLQKLLKRVKIDEDVKRSITRFLRYHPINEFEPFFESLGLNPSEYSSFLPRDLMYLDDDQTLLQSYNLLCNYGFPRSMLGRIYKEAMDVFRSDHNLLQSRLQAIEQNIGLSQDLVVKIVCSSPCLLMGDLDRDQYVLKMLDRLKSVKIEVDWISNHLDVVYNWKLLLELLNLLSNIISSDEQLRNLIYQNPGLLFDSSGNTTYSLISFLLKFGWDRNELRSFLLSFPQINFAEFVRNFRRSYRFLVEIDMDPQGIGNIVSEHPLLLGSCNLPSASGILKTLQTENMRLCDIINENPLILKDVLGLKVNSLPTLNEESHAMRAKFLLELGFFKDSNETKKALKLFRGSGRELQDRFEFLIKIGISKEDVIGMIKVAPQILNQSKELMEMKIDFIVNGLGYPLSAVVNFPSCICYTIQRVKLRLSMYGWLRDKGSVEANRSFSTLLSISDDAFMKRYVDKHSKGNAMWKKLKEQFCSS